MNDQDTSKSAVHCGLCDEETEDWKAHVQSDGHRKRLARTRPSALFYDKVFDYGSKKPRETPGETYNRWWLGKRVRLMRSSDREFKLVKAVIWNGGPSGVYGTVTLIFEDGTEKTVSNGPDGYRPRKYDVEVET